MTSCSWLEEGDSALCQLLEPVLMRLCARYLYTEKRRGSALDSVGKLGDRGSGMEWYSWADGP